jgi:NDP-sugar pyrophosphorylase family protein
MNACGMLLAAGLSTRLEPLSRQLPKPLLPVCNAPLLDWTGSLLRRASIRDVAVNLHHLGQLIRDHLGDGSPLGLQVTYSPEPQILGTGGGIKAMATLVSPTDPCVVVNAKIVTDIDLSAVLDAHRKSGALATMVVRPDPHAERWGAIGVDNDQRVVRILDHKRPGVAQGSAMQFCGIHVLQPEFISAIPEGPCCIIRTAYRSLLEQDAPLSAYVHEGYFYDHSTVARYLEGNLNLLRGAVAPDHAPGPVDGLDPSAEVHPEAKIVQPVLAGPHARIGAGAQVGPDVVLGRDARVDAGIQLEQTVVWHGCHVTRSLRRAVVTPSDVVQITETGDPARSPR